MRNKELTTMAQTKMIEDSNFWVQGQLYEVIQYFEVMPIITTSPIQNYKSLFGWEEENFHNKSQASIMKPGEILFLVKRNFVQIFPFPDSKMFVSYFLDKRGKLVESVFIGPELSPEKYLKRINKESV